MAISLATRLAGREMGGNACYGDLKHGDRFHFPKHPDKVYRKSHGGWYIFDVNHRGPRYRTGSGTAVVVLGAY